MRGREGGTGGGAALDFVTKGFFKNTHPCIYCTGTHNVYKYIHMAMSYRVLVFLQGKKIPEKNFLEIYTVCECEFWKYIYVIYVYIYIHTYI